VKCINTTQISEEKIENYGFSDDSEEEIEKTEKNLYAFEDRRNGKIKSQNDETEYDSDLTSIAKRFEAESVFDLNHAETVRRLKNFFEKNRKKLRENREVPSVNKINPPNQTSTLPSSTQINFYSDSVANLQNDTSLLNKKRNKN
jgi:hypothetical protein